MFVMLAADGISKESKWPDLLVVKLSTVLSLLSLLKAVEGSWHCVACWHGHASPDCQLQKFHFRIKRSYGRKNVAGTPETEPPCIHLDCTILGYPVPGHTVLITPIGPTTASMTVSHASVQHPLGSSCDVFALQASKRDRTKVDGDIN